MEDIYNTKGQLMKVEEAKTKICPFTLQADINLPLTRQAEVFICNNLGGYCIAGDCMAWEWETTYKHYASLPSKPISKSTTDGYCKRIDK